MATLHLARPDRAKRRRAPAPWPVAAAMLALAGTPAVAGELWLGGYSHGVNTPFTKEIGEGGADVQLGYRGGDIAGMRGLQPYVLGSINTAGDTSFAAAGIGWRLGNRIYARPGLGIAIHDGPRRRVRASDGDRTDLGSRILFEPEIGLGVQASERLSIEASWVHLSHAQIFSGQNPGIDMWGVRLGWRL